MKDDLFYTNSETLINFFKILGYNSETQIGEILLVTSNTAIYQLKCHYGVTQFGLSLTAIYSVYGTFFEFNQSQLIIHEPLKSFSISYFSPLTKTYLITHYPY